MAPSDYLISQTGIELAFLYKTQALYVNFVFIVQAQCHLYYIHTGMRILE
jgi:hypothetical protein